MAAQVECKDHAKLIRYQAHRVLRRLRSAGLASVQIEDVEQECWIAWMTAREKWMPEHGVPFIPYMLRGVFHHVNRWVVTELRQRDIAPIEMDRDYYGSGHPYLYDVIADENTQSAEEKIHHQQMLELAKDSVSPRTWQFIELMIEPPPCLNEILNGLQARAEFARNRGVHTVIAPKRITPAMVFDLMECDRLERLEINQELEFLIAQQQRACTIKRRDFRSLFAGVSQR